ncbi:helix-turn-helix domain-containing protein [Dysgonomonas sp. 520]|uniref:helix-turn-helix domain-containing protein n=1 Tax=Dysgonomonas sp. 520 TaxID=2302931 RepID=UPI0013D7950A|nr:helix-turn-helix transcriptional regulator [Dysgonomonas sp. 520]NDW10505.1 XRE family transcriptional regulator [Dysgonomonas sp. 520]
MEAENKERRVHHGHNVRRVRETLGIKQEALAADIGMSQQSISVYEQKKVIEDETLEKIAKALGVAPDLIKNMEDDPLTIIIENNTFGDQDRINIQNENFDNVYNPIEKIIELTNEKVALYERMLALEQEKVAMLERLLNEKK